MAGGMDGWDGGGMVRFAPGAALVVLSTVLAWVAVQYARWLYHQHHDKR